MAYQRKTKDVWEFWVDYGQGWEHETTEASRKDAVAQRRCYRDNGIYAPIKIRRRREPIVAGEIVDPAFAIAQCGAGAYYCRPLNEAAKDRLATVDGHWFGGSFILRDPEQARAVFARLEAEGFKIQVGLPARPTVAP